MSDRHQLSTSNNLRNSNALNELEDSSRRSTNGTKNLPLNKSVTSGDYSNGSGSSSKKKALDIDLGQSDIKLTEYRARNIESERATKINDSIRKYSIKEEQAEEDQATPIETRKMGNEDNYSDEDYELEQKMKDALDAEVDK